MRLMRRYIEAARQQVRRQKPDYKLQRTAAARPTEAGAPAAGPTSRHPGWTWQRPPACRLRGDPVKFQHIVSNLVVNAH
jgi:hypothetical protein